MEATGVDELDGELFVAEQRAQVLECLERQARVARLAKVHVVEDQTESVLFEHVHKQLLVLSHRSQVTQDQYLARRIRQRVHLVRS